MDLSTINKIYKFVDYINKEDTEIVDLGKDEIDLLFKLKELDNARVDEALSIIKQKREIIYNVNSLYNLSKREYERLGQEDLKEAQKKVKEIYDYLSSLYVLKLREKLEDSNFGDTEVNDMLNELYGDGTDET